MRHTKKQIVPDPGLASVEIPSRPNYHPRAPMNSHLAAGFVALVLLSGLVGGCVTPTAGRGGAVVGMVELRGHEQELVLNVRGDYQLALMGAPSMVDQLDRLVGARVSIRGGVSETSVRVRSFQILEAPDGLVPYVGRLVRDQAGIALDDETTGTRLGLRTPEIEAMGGQHGARIWVTGTVVGPQLLLVAHWGVLVPPPD